MSDAETALEAIRLAVRCRDGVHDARLLDTVEAILLDGPEANETTDAMGVYGRACRHAAERVAFMRSKSGD